MKIETAPRERLTEWSPLREGLARVEEAVHAVQSAVIAMAGVQPPRISPVVRPITEADRARGRLRQQEHKQLVKRLLPH